MANYRDGMKETGDQVREFFDATTKAAGQVVESASAKLKAVGVDTDAMVEAAKDQAGQLQEMIADEVRKRPFHALALATLVGFWFGIRR